MAHITHVIFDWNGTLLDDVHVCLFAANTMMRRRQLAPLTLDGYRAVFGFPVQDTYRKLGFDLERESWDALSDEFHTLYQQGAGEARLRSGAKDYVQELAKQGIGRSVLSASGQTLLRSMMTTMGILDCFDSVYGLPDMHARSKSGVGQDLMREQKLDPARVLLVGDTLHDDEVARELGCRCVLISQGHQAVERLTASGAPVVHRLDDISPFIDLR